MTNASRRILVVEDDPVINQAVSDRLVAEGYDVVRAYDGPGAVAAYGQHAPDLVLLDVMLPGYDGLEVCRRIQAERPVPVLMLTARVEEADVLTGLGVGADDYLTKPFSMKELVARIAALLRRVERAAELVGRRALELGDLRLDAGARRVWRDEEEVRLTPTEFDLLVCLASRPGTVVTREQLMAEVWDWPGASGTRTVDSHVKGLRAKIGGDRIRTVHGVGYSFEPQGQPVTTAQPLARVTSLKVKLGLLVAASVTVAAVVASLGKAGGVPVWLSIPVTILLALAVTQLLAVGMTSPLRQMTAAAARMATGDYAVRVTDTSGDEVGDLARAFNTMARDLATVDRQRRDLVANVSHELRTPLAGLVALLENLADGVAPRDPQSLTSALDQARRTSHLVEDLLDLARVDAGKAPLTPQPVPVGPLLEDAIADAGVGGRDVWYSARVEPVDLVVRADPARLHQLVANLLDNASRHSPTGGSVSITARRDRDHWTLEVEDQGHGVDEADRERVFEPFGTLAVHGGGGGTGLGLAIARWVTDLHGGSIAFVDPRPGQSGARVRASLPLQPSDRPARLEEEPMPTAPPPAVPPQAPAAPVAVPAPSLLDGVFGAFWPEHGVPARLAILLGAVGAGLLAGLVLPFHDLGVGTFVVLLAAGGVILVASRRRDAYTLTCAGLCVLLAAATMLRDADWIDVVCLMAGAALCVCTVTGARTPLGFVLSGLAWPLAGLRGLPWLGRTIARLTGMGRSAAVMRTVVLSLLGLLVFGALFASADALVAEWWSDVLPDLSLGSAVLRVFVAVAVGGAVLAAAYVALNPPHVDPPGLVARAVSHRFEWLAPVLVVNAVFAAFLVAQAAVIFGGHDYVERTTGLTYADYVHQGFGQLTVATALTLLVIWATARKVPREIAGDRWWMRVSLGTLCGQTLVVVLSALHRMNVYQDAYGFTQLRLLVDVFEGWLGVLVLAVAVAGVVLRAEWLPRFALISGVVALLGLAAINPDAWIARQNVDRYETTGRIDYTYLRTLSDDAVPVLADLPLPARYCALENRRTPDDDWLEWNLGRVRARDALASMPAPQNTNGIVICQDS